MLRRPANRHVDLQFCEQILAIAWLVLLVGSVFQVVPTMAQSVSDSVTTSQTKLQEERDACRGALATLQRLMARTPMSASIPAEVREAYLSAQNAQYRHYVGITNYRVDILYWQRTAATIVLLMVVVVVAAGVIFSAMQLRQVMALGTPQATNELEISAGRIRVTSSIAGIAVLAISLGFFYLFSTQIFGLEPIN